MCRHNLTIHEFPNLFDAVVTCMSISKTSTEVPAMICWHDGHTLSETVGPSLQLSDFARIRAQEVFPIPEIRKQKRMRDPIELYRVLSVG